MLQYTEDFSSFRGDATICKEMRQNVNVGMSSWVLVCGYKIRIFKIYARR